MATLEDESPTEAPEQDPEIGKVRIEVEIKVNRDVGLTHYGSRDYKTEHQVTLSIGPNADPHRIKDYVGNAVAGFLRINDSRDDVRMHGPYEIPLGTFLEALKAAAAENAKSEDRPQHDEGDADIPRRRPD